MSFTSYNTVFVFLPLVVAGVWLLQKAKTPVFSKVFLILASLFFYAWANAAALFWLLLSASVSYLLACAIHRTAREKTLLRKTLLGLGIVFHILLLSAFKYLDLASLRALLSRGAAFLLVPMGVSFFTFQFIVFLIEVYRAEDEPGNLLDFSLFATLFLYRTMGPIMSHSDFRNQMETGEHPRVNGEGLSRGIYQFILGLSKKLILADTLSVMVSGGFSLDGNIGLLAGWGTALAYTFQLYFDFSGYSDMASGIGRMIGIRLPQNFDSPYKSESVSVFWRRWHMTLGRALTKSVYISLGGNRRGNLRTCLNLFLVMAVSGIWHGDTVNFLLWGAAYGLILVFERVASPFLHKIPSGLRRAGTFLCVVFLWVPFRAPTLQGALTVWRGMLDFNHLYPARFASIVQDKIIDFPTNLAILYGIAQLLLSAVLVFLCKNSEEKTRSARLTTKTALFLAILFFLCLIHMSRATVFLYENF